MAANPVSEKRYRRDARGLVRQVENRTLGRTLEYGLDAAGRRTRVRLEGPAGFDSRLEYDRLGRITSMSDQATGRTTFSYDTPHATRRYPSGMHVCSGR